MRVLVFLIISLLGMLSQAVWAGDVKTVAVLDTELIIDNKPTPHSPDRPGEVKRAGYMTSHIRQALEHSDVYQTVSLEDAAKTIAELKESQQYLHKCDSCIKEIGQALGVDFVATAWVQVVSNLIVNLNLVLHDAETGEAVRTSFVDIRGNNNSTWRNGTNYMLEKFFRQYHSNIPEQALEQAQSVWPDQES